MKVKLSHKQHEVDNVWSFFFEISETFFWQAGQALRWELPHQEGQEREAFEHWFTISSAPSEKHLRITTRLSGSDFKNALDSLKIGDEIIADGLEGDFIWVESNLPKVFIAGGIGITPFRSMFAERKHHHQASLGHLIYANRDEQITFKEELENIKGLKITFITGQLTPENILKVEPNLNNLLVYLSGPEPMVESLGAVLIKSGLPEVQFKRDWFPGYTTDSYFK